MTKHSQAAEGDRHPPVNRTFTNTAARLAYSYNSEDVGKWYKDADTNIIWELDNTYLPGFSQVTAVGTALYSFPFKVITVDANEPSADYSTIAGAIATAVSGDVISVGPGTYICDNQTLPANVDMVGYGMGVTILTTTGVTALTVGDDSHVADMTIQSVNASGNAIPVLCNGADATLHSVEAIASDVAFSNNARSFHINGSASSTILIGCRASGAGSTSHALYIEGDGVTVHQGSFTASTGDVYATGAITLTLIGPQLRTATPITTASGATVNGSYYDTKGDIVIGRYETGDLPAAGKGGRLLYDITTGHLLLDVGLSLIDPP